MGDLYHFDTDPDPEPGCAKIRYRSGSGSRVNFDASYGQVQGSGYNACTGK